MQKMEFREQRHDVRILALKTDEGCEKSFFVLKAQRRELLVVVLESALDRETTNSTWIATEIYLVERINVIRTF